MSPARLRSALQALKELLVDPGTFFGDREIAQSLPAAAAVVLVGAVVVTGALGAVGWTLGQQIDATYTETVTEPWSDSTCEQFAEMEMETTPKPCGMDEPETREVDVGEEAWSAFAGALPLVFVAVPVGWLLTAGGLHVLSAPAGGRGSFTSTLTVAGWATVPSMVATVVTVANMLMVVRSQSFATDPDLLAEQVRQMATNFRTPLTVGASIAATVWQIHIWAQGLLWARDLDFEPAYGVAVVVGVVSLLFSLL